MKKILLILLLSTHTLMATHHVEFFVYNHHNYLQGPWKGADKLDDTESYLLAELHSALAGSEETDIPLKIIELLSHKKPDLYRWNYDIEYNKDTLFLYPDAPLLTPVEFNEILASFTQLNYCNYVAISIDNEVKTYASDNIAFPFFTLASFEMVNTDEEHKDASEKESNFLASDSILKLILGAVLGIILMLIYTYWKKRK